MTGLHVCLHPDSGLPLYRQLVDALSAQIKSGHLPAGIQLPTVRDLSEEMGIAVGTIKRAYDELERTGLVEKAQGRGTFVLAQASQDSRKARAMEAIDQMLSRLEEMDFSLAEIQIYLDLKLRQRAADRENLKVALVECNPEVLAQLPRQLRRLEGVDLYPYLLREGEGSLYQMGQDMDLVITTREHAEQVADLTGQPEKVAKIVLSLHPKCVSRILKLQPGKPLGILCASQRFGQLLERFCREYLPDREATAPVTFAEAGDLISIFGKMDAILLPKGYEKYATAQQLDQLRQLAETCTLIPCTYQADGGSLLYAGERIQRLRQRKLGGG